MRYIWLFLSIYIIANIVAITYINIEIGDPALWFLVIVLTLLGFLYLKLYYDERKYKHCKSNKKSSEFGANYKKRQKTESY